MVLKKDKRSSYSSVGRSKMSIEEIKKKILPALKKYGVEKAAFFGSFARGEQREGSDLDILVEFKDRESKTLLDLVGLELELEEVLNHKVDVLTYNSIHPLLRTHILKEQEVFYEERS
jgi:hypothetical protein